MSTFRGKFVGHRECPECGKNDNLAVWYIEELGQETYYCFTPGCGHKKTTTQVFREAGVPIPERYTTSEVVPYQLPDGCERFDKWYRKVPPEVYQQYGVVLFEGYPVFPYWDRFNSQWVLCGAKFARRRDDPRGRFWVDGHMPSKFFGQHISDSRTLVVTEGEYDAIAVRYATGYSVWSVNAGARSAPGLVEKNLEELDKFQKVVFFLDNDEDGIKATIKCLEILENGYWAVPPDGLKDASDVIQELGKSGLASVVAHAKPNEPPFIVRDIETPIKQRITGADSRGFPTGIRGLDERIGGWRSGEVTVILAETSKGKSTLSRWFAAQQMKAGRRVAYIPLEDGRATGGAKLLEAYFGVRYITGDVTAPVDEAVLDEQIKEVSSRLVMADSVSTLADVKRIIRYSVKCEHVSFVVLDHLTALAFKATGQLTMTIPQIMTTLRELALKYGCHILIVSHVRRTEDGQITISSGYGSNSIETVTDNLLILTRKSDGISDKVFLEVSKCRAWGLSENPVIQLLFDYEKQAYQPL